MRLLITISCALLAFGSQTHRAHAQVDMDIERAKIAADIFTRACFINFGKRGRAIAYLDAEFHKHDDPANAQIFLDFTKTKKGDVWVAALAKGVFVIVLSDRGNCHVIAQKANRDQVHASIAVLADKAQSKLDLPLEKQGPSSGSATKSSGFEVIGKRNQNLMTVVASTPVEQAENKPDAIITMAVESY